MLFPSVRERSSVAVLARRCFPDRPELLIKAFEHLVRNADRFSYVVLDLRPRLTQEVLRVRHSFRLDAPLVSYLRAEDAPRLPSKVQRAGKSSDPPPASAKSAKLRRPPR